MADKYINEVGVGVIRDWANGKFALDSDLDTLDTKVEQIIAEGGEPNIIETVKVNGTALTPDAQKAVNVDLSGYAETSDIPTDLSDLTNTGADPYATQAYVGQNGGKIDVIKVNGTAQTITNKEVDLAIPTKVSDLTNDSNFQTDTQVAAAISSAVSSAYEYKGAVATVADLPSTGQAVGDVYDVQATGMNYAWNGTAWDALGQYVDTSVFWTSTAGQTNTLEAMTVAEVNAILNPSA